MRKKNKQRSTEADLLEELRAAADKRRGLTETAERLGLSVQFISDVIYGRRGVTDRLAEKMGYRRVVEYERVSE